MAGLGEILEENNVLRERLETMEAVLHAKDSELHANASELRANASELRAKDVQIAKHAAMMDALRKHAENLARKLELIRLSHAGAASHRHVADEQEVLPFDSDIAPPPRAPVHEAQDVAEDSSKKKRKKAPKRRNRDSLKHMKSRTVRCVASDDAVCAGCGGPLKVIGQAESFRVEWVPGHFIVEDVVRDKCACPKCPSEGVLTVPGPYALERSLCGNGLLSRVLVDKFCDHIPLNRQVRRMSREGLKITSNTLASWVKKSAGLLGIVAKSVRSDLMDGTFIQGDDTGFPVQDAGNGALRKGRLWAFTDQAQVFYAFTATKEGEYPTQLLNGFSGDLLLVDGGSEFNRVVRELGLKRSGCWSHLRTYFFHARHHHPGEAFLALGTIRDLFMIERELQGKPPDHIRELRQTESRILVDGLFEWVQAVSKFVRPKSALGDAITYARNQEASLRLFLEYGELPMHNNLSELMLRQAVVGRKNWLFARSEGGADAAATIYTLVGSCMLQGIDPHAYLVDVLRRLPEHASSRVYELTPAVWARERHGQDHMVATR